MESALQKKIRVYLEKKGWEVVRPITLSKGGYEDLFCFKDGVTMFIEVKDKDKYPRPLQAYKIQKHNENGFYSFFCNSWESFLLKYVNKN